MKPFALMMLVAASAAALIPLAPAQAKSKHRSEDGQDKALIHVARATRMEQRCNERAMRTIQREQKGMRPDELVAYAFDDTHLKDDTIRAPGAAVRSRGHWYHLSYRCTTSEDGMDVRDFDYKLGAEVPKEDWAAHYLVEP